MTKNPFYNALAALLYIVTISSVMYYGSRFSGGEDTILAPIAALSLFTLSAAVMAYIFGFEPAQLYFDGKKKKAVQLFLQTLATFAGITIVLVGLMFSGVL